MTLKTTDGFWRSFDRDHEALPGTNRAEGLKTTGHFGPHTRGFTCGTCGMPCHLEHHSIDADCGPDMAFGRLELNVWVPRHGPAPHSPHLMNKELAGTTPVIELPDATVMVDVSQGKRHLPVQGTQEGGSGRMTVANLLCGTITDKHWVLKLGDCWHAEPCKLCIETVK